MHLIRLLKVRGHLGQELVRADTHVHREAKRVLNLVLQLSRHSHCIFWRTAQAHVNEALINGELLQHRRIGPANSDEAL